MPDRETAVVFQCDNQQLLGVLHSAHESSKEKRIAIIIVVGGPQYRVGSHRQFVLMARQLTCLGYACFRFDYRGMGDSDGNLRDFRSVRLDISCAIEKVTELLPSHKIVLMGLCDAASAILMQASNLPLSVKGLVLLNPWVRTDSGYAKAQITQYYSKRLFEPSFWRKVLSRDLDLVGSISSFIDSIRNSLFEAPETLSYIDTMDKSIEQLNVPLAILLSAKDLTAEEFRKHNLFRKISSSSNIRCTAIELPDADHTLSDTEARKGATNHIHTWISSISEN